MKNKFEQAKDNEGIQELSTSDVEKIYGGRTVYLDGVQVEMSDMALSGLINTGAAKAVVIKGVTHPFFQGVDW